MKKEYASPKSEVIEFKTNDVIDASDSGEIGVPGPLNPNETGDDWN